MTDTKDQQLTAEEWSQIGRAIARLRASVMATVFGFTGGFVLFLATIWLVITSKPGVEVGPTLSLLNNYFPGYSVSVGGSILGFLYGALTGAVIGWVVATVYNSIVSLRRGNG